MLYNVMWGMHNDDSVYTTRPSSPADLDDLDDVSKPRSTSARSLPKAKKPRRSNLDSDSDLSDIDLSSDIDEPKGKSRVLDSAEEGSGDESADIGEKRKRADNTSPGSKSKLDSTSSRLSKFGGVTSERKYSLDKIAETDAGRVMFVFERSAKSAMLDAEGKKVGSSREASVAEV